MRKLNINKRENKGIGPLGNLPEELIWIEKVALEFAKTKADLRKFYKCGIIAFQKHTDCNGKEKHKVFVVRQAMLKLLNKTA